MRVKTISKRDNQLIVYIVSLSAFIMYLLSLQTLSFLDEFELIKFLFNWLGIFIFLFIIITWKRITNQVFTPYIIFITFFFLFNYGQPLMWAFGIHTSDEIGVSPIYPGLDSASDYDIVKGQSLVLTSILMFHLGAIFSFKNNTKRELPLIKRKQDNMNRKFKSIITLKVIFYVSLSINLIVAPLTIYALYLDYQTASDLGYSALYYSEYARKGLSILGLAEIFFFPSLIGLLIGSKFNKKVRYYVYTIFSLFLLLNIAVGERGTWVYKIIILTWIIHQSYKALNFKKVLMLTPVIILGLYLLNAVVSLRNKGISMKNILESLSFKESPIVLTIFEMGGSMNPMLYLIKYGWDIWPYSNTYVLALGGLFSNKLLDMLDVPWQVVSGFFREFLGISWGPGFSIVAEPLLNFGPVFAPLFMILLGYIITSIIYVDKNVHYKDEPIKILFVVSSLDILTHLTRNSIHVPLKEWFYSVVILCLFIYIIRNILCKKYKNLKL